MSTQQIGGFAIIAQVSDLPEVVDAIPQITMFYSVPTKVHSGQSLTVFWATLNSPNVSITSTSGLVTGKIPSNINGYFDLPAGITKSTTFTITALDAGGNPLGASATLNVSVI